MEFGKKKRFEGNTQASHLTLLILIKQKRGTKMIAFIKQWANQIIVAVIIATIFEMILPNGNNKKYIKMVIGIYVLFTLIQPIASKITGNEITISTNYEKYFDEDIIDISSTDFENNNSKLIEEAYINNIKEDVQAKIEQKEYKVTSCKINIITTEENYGAIDSIVLNIQKKERNEDLSNRIEIEKVEISVGEEKVVEASNITDEEKQNIIDYLAKEYSIEQTKIVID